MSQQAYQDKPAHQMSQPELIDEVVRLRTKIRTMEVAARKQSNLCGSIEAKWGRADWVNEIARGIVSQYVAEFSFLEPLRDALQEMASAPYISQEIRDSLCSKHQETCPPDCHITYCDTCRDIAAGQPILNTRKCTCGSYISGPFQTNGLSADTMSCIINLGSSRICRLRHTRSCEAPSHHRQKSDIYTLTCSLCGAPSPAVSEEDNVIDAAVDTGWTVDGHNEDDRDVCPKCQPRAGIATSMSELHELGCGCIACITHEADIANRGGMVDTQLTDEAKPTKYTRRQIKSCSKDCEEPEDGIFATVIPPLPPVGIDSKEQRMDLKKLQSEVNERWSRQINNPCHRSADANHALLHMTKALGKIASALNDAEHEERVLTESEVDKYLADLVICAARFSDGMVDLSAACAARLAEKFPVSGG